MLPGHEARQGTQMRDRRRLLMLATIAGLLLLCGPAPLRASPQDPRGLSLVGQVGGLAAGVVGLDEHVVVAVGARLFVFRDGDPPGSPPVGMTEPALLPITDLVADADRSLVVAVGPEGSRGLLRVFDLGVPSSPVEAGRLELPVRPQRIQRHGEAAWVFGSGIITGIDLSRPSSPRVSTVLRPDSNQSIVQFLDMALDADTGLGLIHASEATRIPFGPNTPTPPIDSNGPAASAVAMSTGPAPPVMQLLDVRTPSAPVVSGGVAIGNRRHGGFLHVDGPRALLAWGRDLLILQVDERGPSVVEWVDGFSSAVGRSIRGLRIDGDRVWVAFEQNIALLDWNDLRKGIDRAAQVSALGDPAGLPLLQTTADGGIYVAYPSQGVARYREDDRSSGGLVQDGWLAAPVIGPRDMTMAAGRLWIIDRWGGVRDIDPARPSSLGAWTVSRRSEAESVTQIDGEGDRLAWSRGDEIAWVDLAREAPAVGLERPRFQAAEGGIWRLDWDAGRLLAVSPEGSHVIEWTTEGPQRSPRLSARRPEIGRLTGDLAWLDSGLVLEAVDLSDLAAPRLVGEWALFPVFGRLDGLEPDGERLWLSTSNLGVIGLEFPAAGTPTPVGRIDLPGAGALALEGRKLWVRWFDGRDGGLALIDVSLPELPDELGRVQWPLAGGRPVPHGDCVFFDDRRLGVLAFALLDEDGNADPEDCRLGEALGHWDTEGPLPTATPSPSPQPAAGRIALPWILRSAP